MKLKVLGDWILISEAEEREKEDFQLFQDNSLARNVGTVVGIGNEVKINRAVVLETIVVNSKVYYGNQYEKIQIEGEDYLIMKYDNLYGIIKG